MCTSPGVSHMASMTGSQGNKVQVPTESGCESDSAMGQTLPEEISGPLRTPKQASPSEFINGSPRP